MDEQSIFLRALEHPQGDVRNRWLDEVCGNDFALRNRIDALLKHGAQMGRFLESPPSSLDVTVVHTPNLDSASDSLANQGRDDEQDDEPVVGSAVQGVLKSLGIEFEIPHVALREEEGIDPISRPRSSEISKTALAGRYQVLGEIARGGMGAILKGRDTDLGRDLAIKVLLDTHRNKPEVIQRFIEEAQIGGQLQHPGIAPIYELGRFSDDRPFFAMKLVKGQTLSKLLNERATPTNERGRFIGIFEHVCQTMAYAHSRGVIHRDLKPANIMVGAFGEVQVMDWGLAKVLVDGGVNDERRALTKYSGHSVIETLRSGIGSDSPASVGTAGSHTQIGSVMGTPAYMPPEQALGEVHTMDERADVFALGAILCEILTGKPPYVAEDGTRLFKMAMRGKLEDCFARLASCDADEELLALTMDCLKLEPSDRPRDASILAHRVREYLESVEARLRDTEMERAAQAARAEAEAIRLAQQQQATRNLRKMLAGLAVVASLAVSTSLVAAWLWQRATDARNQAQASEALARSNAKLADQNAKDAERQYKLAIEQQQRAESNLIQAEEAERAAAIARNLADQRAETASRNLYISQMHLAHKSFDDYRSVQRMRDLLGNWVPGPGAPDRRGWEWFYLHSLSYQNVRTLPTRVTSSQPSTLALHAKSNRLAEGLNSGIIRIWDLEREAVVQELHTPKPRTSVWEFKWLDWNPNGSSIAGGFQDGTVRIWDSRTGEESRILRDHSSPVTSVGFGSDGTRIAACGADGKICFWDVNTGRLSMSISHPSGIRSGAWSADNKRYATGNNLGDVTISDSETGSEIASWRAEPNGVHCLAWSPDGTKLTTTGAGSFDQFHMHVWNVASQQLAFEPLRHNHSITAIAWDPNGKRFASGTMAEEIRIWDSDTGKEINSLHGHVDPISSLSWGEGEFLASGSDHGEVKIWTSISNQTGTRLPGETALRSVRWSPDGMLMASADDNGRVVVRDADTNRERFSVQAHERKNISSSGFIGFNVALAWSPDSTQLATAALDGIVKIWDMRTEREIYASTTNLGSIWCVDWSPDGAHLAVGSLQGKIHIIEARKLDPNIHTFQALEPYHDAKDPFGVTAIAWSPDGLRLASCGGDQLSKVWDPHRGVELVRMEGQNSWVFDVAWSPDGRHLASTGADANILVWNSETGHQQTRLRRGQEFVTAVAWSPDGSRIASAHLSGEIQIWDPIHGEECCNLRVPFARFLDVAWNPDGARIAGATNLGDLWVWDATSGFEQDETSRALPYLQRAINSGIANNRDRLSYAKMCLDKGNYDEALTALHDDPVGLCQISPILERAGKGDLAQLACRQARTTLERELQSNPTNRINAFGLVELMLRDIEKRAAWTPVHSLDWTSQKGADLTVQKDDSILASGTLELEDVYSATSTVRLSQIAAVRIEALTDDSLPSQGPGRHSSGNFHLRALRMFTTPTNTESTMESARTRLSFSDAFASFDYRADDARIEGILEDGKSQFWHVWGRTGQAHQAVFRVKNPEASRRNTATEIPITIELEQGIPLGRFRISVSANPNTYELQTGILYMRNLSDPWDAIAVAYLLLGDQPSLENVLRVYPKTAAAVAGFHCSIKEWDAAIEIYNQLLTPESTDVSLLSKRAAAYAANQQWELATKDWLRVIDFKPDLSPAPFDTLCQAKRWREALTLGRQRIDAAPEDEAAWLRVAPVAAMAGEESYREFCQQLLLQFPDPTDPVVAERVTKSCLLRPNCADLRSLPMATLTQAIENNTAPDWLVPWAWSAKALFAYRSGDPQSAVDFVAKSQAMTSEPRVLALNLAIEVLAKYELNPAERNERQLDYLSQWIEKRNAVSKSYEQDITIIEILCHEAQTRLQSP